MILWIQDVLHAPELAAQAVNIQSEVMNQVVLPVLRHAPQVVVPHVAAHQRHRRVHLVHPLVHLCARQHALVLATTRVRTLQLYPGARNVVMDVGSLARVFVLIIP